MAYNNAIFNTNATRKVDTDMECGVCAQKPARMNFGAISCVSCKMFFRRHEHFDMVVDLE